ncbi:MULTISPECIES: ABC1 kinase family protein [unclassified Mycobacterium]|uniref:ABC1 kinase family protein n=1 Tax=unclassified Mycobacterium TaxID=2642494 RepID=UPI0029C825EB|nr:MULTISPECIES: AarF/UbiB family protein [unclassified Mycobacterium]
MTHVTRLVWVFTRISLAAFKFGWRTFICRQSVPAVMAEELRDLFVCLGPAYIKVGQLLSTRNDLLPPSIVQRLAMLRDELPAINEDDVRRAILRSFGVPVEAIFSDFSYDTIGSGSIACVYRAVADDGCQVAVKIRRPGVHRQIASDVDALSWLAATLSHLPPLSDLPILESVSELGRWLNLQTDFVRERKMIDRMAAALAPERRVRVPRVFEHLCSSDVITMEYLPEFHNKAGGDLSESAITALRMLYRMIFVAGLVHCDLHPSNLALCANGNVCLTDFGFVAELRASGRLGFAEFFYCISRNHGAQCADIALRMAASRPSGLNRARFTAEIAEAVDAVSGAQAEDFSVGRFALQMFDIQRRYRVRSTTSFQMAIMSLAVLEGIIRTYEPALDFQAEARPYLIRASLEQTEPTR